MRSFTIAVLLCVSITAFSQSTAKKTFLVSASSSAPLTYNHITTIDLNTGKTVDDLFDPQKNYSSRNNGFKSYEKCDSKKNQGDDTLRSPLGSGAACLAFDAKSNRIFYVPLQLSELRYMDLKESEPSFTCLENQSINLMHNRTDVAGQITRMAINGDGIGYALSNDGEHLIKFTTTGTPVIQDLGVLIDNPKNEVLVRSSCSSWGGDMVCAADGSLYLVALHNHVFHISLPSKKCDYIGTIKNLPAEFFSNGASVDENGDLLVSCGTSYGKNFSPIYKVKWPSLEATAVDVHNSGIGNIADMGSSNLLFQKENKKATNTVANFGEVVEADNANNLPNISVFPNPVSHGKFQIRTTNMKEKGEYKMLLLDVNGKAIMEGKMNLGLKTNTNTFTFPAQNAKGVYFVQIADIFNRTIYSQQLIVE
jgi:hypothetical protein